MNNIFTSHDINHSNNFIGGWFDSNMAEFADRAIAWYEQNPKKFQGRTEKNGQVGVYSEDKSSTECALEVGHPITEEYFSLLQRCVNAYIDLYPWCNQYAPWRVIQRGNFQHYSPGEAYFSWHTERANASDPSVTRHLVYMTYLNTVTDGGETEFYHQKEKIKPYKGLTLIWPADWTFTHRGVASLTEHKYIITGWFNYV